MGPPLSVPAKDYRGSLLEPLGMLARRLREKWDAVPSGWVEDTEKGMRQGKVLAWVSPPTGEPGGILLLTVRHARVYGHIFVAEPGDPERDGKALGLALLANLPPGTRRLDLTVSATDRRTEAALGTVVSTLGRPFRTLERQCMIRSLEDADPPPVPSLPPGYAFRWALDLDVRPMAELDFRVFEESPDQGLVAATSEDSLRLMGEMLRGEMAPLVKEGSPCVVRESDPDQPVGFVLSMRQSATSALIADVAVAPEMRRRGIGRALLSRALRGLLASGHTRVRLWVTCHNLPACALYEQFGFVVEQREPIYIWEEGAPSPRS